MALGTGVNSWVASTAEYNSELYVGGMFYTAGGISAQYMAKWDGLYWAAGSGIGGGLNPFIDELFVHDSQLFIGGQFSNAGGVLANNIARLTDVATFILDESNHETDFSDLVVYPNPVEDFLRINWHSPVKTWFYDSFGRMILSEDSLQVIDVSSFTKGVYSVVVTEINGHALGTFTFLKL